jgi:hypothetical protein
MADTPIMQLPLIAASQAQKHVTHNEALMKLDAITQLSVIDRSLSAPPPSPTEGQRYIVGSAPTGAWVGQSNKIAVYANLAWIFYTPVLGWSAYVETESLFVVFSATSWVVSSSGGSSGNPPINVQTLTANKTLVLADAAAYLRMNLAIANTVTVPDAATAAFPIGTVVQIRQAGAGQTTIVASPGVTINSAETLKLRKQGSTAALIKVGANEWDLTGDLE